MSVSLEMGFKHNNVYRFEAAVSKLYWTDFVDFCHACNLSIEDIFFKCYYYSTSLKDQENFLAFFVPNDSEIITKELINKRRFDRLRKNELKLLATEVFLILDKHYFTLVTFLNLLSPERTIEAFSNEQETYRNRLKVYADYPWMSLVKMAINSDEYAKSTLQAEDFLANYTKLPKDIVIATLNEFEKNNVIVKNVQGKYTISDASFSPRGIDRKKAQLFWLSVVLQNIHHSLAGESFKPFREEKFNSAHWGLGKLSAEGIKELNENARVYLESITTIIDKDKNTRDEEKKYPILLSLNLVDIEFLPCDMDLAFKIYSSCIENG